MTYCNRWRSPHQLSLAPGDAVAGDVAEVAAPGDLDPRARLTLPLLLRGQHLQQALGEVLL